MLNFRKRTFLLSALLKQRTAVLKAAKGGFGISGHKKLPHFAKSDKWGKLKYILALFLFGPDVEMVLGGSFPVCKSFGI